MNPPYIDPTLLQRVGERPRTFADWIVEHRRNAERIQSCGLTRLALESVVALWSVQWPPSN